ncbi:MAG: hypothetical protein IJU70_06490 [Lentisphaeria bacterium]|nr:hypothetical protein [Lentisphaeria bacterium]
MPQIVGEKGNDKSYGSYGSYQSHSEIHRGATTFSGDWNATITLFEGAADASTLIHELGHYTFETMRKLVERGLGDERMTDDWNKLLNFIGAKPGEELTGEQNEKLARAFEAYTMEGRAPSVELEGAFATLRYLLTQIYKSVKALGVKLNDEVRAVFDGLLATDEAADAASVINEAAREINAELLGLSQSEVKTYRELIEKANRQTVQELTARKNKELEELRPQWRKEAADQMAANPVYSAWKEALTAPLDFTDALNLSDEQTAHLLRSRGLASAPGRKSEAKTDAKTGDLLKPAGYYNAKPGVHPAEVAMKHGFDSAEEMLRALASALTPADYVGAYLAEREAAFHAQFKASEAALTAQASIDALEKLSELLAVKGGMAGYRVRREMFKRRALDGINSTPVSRIVSDSELIGSCRRSARELTAAVNGSDFKTAFEMAQKLRFNLEVLRHKAAARKVVSQTENLLKKARHAKKGVIYGDHQDALLDLSVRFGFTRPGKAYTHTVASVIREYNEQAAEEGYAPLDVPEWLLNGNIPYGGMPFGEFTMLSELAQFLNGEGRSLVKGRRAAFNAEVTQSIEGCVGALETQKHRYTRDSLLHAPRVLFNFGTKLRNIIGMAAKWDKNSPLQKLYDEMVSAAADETHLMAEPAAKVREALDALHKASKNFNLAAVADIPFPADVRAWGYRTWDAQKVIAACLNMGTAKNRQRLIDGYEWGDQGDVYCARIASLLSAEDWANIQKLWNAVGNSSLSERVRQTFKEEKHFDLKMEEPVPFDVTTSDGQTVTMEGGYYPLAYLFHKNNFVQSEAEAAAHASPAFRRASFTFERTEQLSDPVSLDLNLIHTHIFDTAHYVSHRRIMAKVLRVINDYRFRSHFQQTQGFERYQALKDLCTNIAAPGAFLKGMTSGFENWGRAALTASALWVNPSVVAMQLTSFTYGIDELGAAYPEAVAQFFLHPMETRDFVLTRSGLMRDRVNLKDIDLRTPLNKFTESTPEHFRRLVMEFGYAPMRFVDLAVAMPAWMAAYNKAMDSGADEIKAVAAADEFVAATQGATRPIDLSPLQLKAWGRSLTVFFSAVSAGSTMGTKTLNRIVNGSMTKYEAAFAAAANLLAPLLLAGAVRMLTAGSGGDDDPERPWRALIRELISNPFQGVPILRDAADFVAGGIARKATGKKFLGTQRTVIENTAFRAVSDLIVTAVEGIDAAVDDNPERALYKLADAAGVFFRVPVIGVYERARRTLGSWTGDPDLLPDFDKRTRTRKNQHQW